MAVYVKWDNGSKTILRYIFDGRWTVDELHSVGNPSMQVTHPTNARVYIIADMRRADGLPMEFFSTRPDSLWRVVPSFDRMIIVARKPRIIRALELHFRFSGRTPRYPIVPTLDQAYEFIRQRLSVSS